MITDMGVSKAIFIIMITCGVLFETAGDYFFKKWAIGGGHLMVFLGLTTYFIGTVFWAYSLHYETLSKAITVFMILSILLVTLIGVFVFHEHLSLANRVGIGLGIFSLLLLELF